MVSNVSLLKSNRGSFRCAAALLPLLQRQYTTPSQSASLAGTLQKIGLAAGGSSQIALSAIHIPEHNINGSDASNRPPATVFDNARQRRKFTNDGERKWQRRFREPSLRGSTKFAARRFDRHVRVTRGGETLR
jgi:hypothetical protein